MNKDLLLDLLKQTQEQSGDWRVALEEAISMVEVSIATGQTTVTNFGTSEEYKMVPVKLLEPGVRVAGHRFDRMNTVIVQDISSTELGPAQFKVTVAEQETGDVLTKWFYGHAPMECWGRI